MVKREVDVPKPTTYHSKSLRRTASMRRKKMHAIQQPPGLPVYCRSCAMPPCLSQLFICVLADKVLSDAPPLDSPGGDHDVEVKSQPSASTATSKTDLEQENLDLKREVGLH